MQKTNVLASEAKAVKLTAEQVQFYADNGHLSVDGVTTSGEILEMRAIIQKLFKDRIGEREGAYRADLRQLPVRLEARSVVS